MRLAGRRVLVVEDEYFIADDITRALQREGAYVLGPTATPAEALRLLENERPDLGILDINLRGSTGLRVADAFADLEIPFVFATGYDAAMVPRRHANVPIWHKPFEVSQLVGSVATSYGTRD